VTNEPGFSVSDPLRVDDLRRWIVAGLPELATCPRYYAATVDAAWYPAIDDQVYQLIGELHWLTECQLVEDELA
jgi:hypothetical protein